MESEEESTSRERSGETKRRRTREKLISAADFVMREDSFQEATVSAIAEEAGISSATFYNFYRTRDELCADAFSTLVLEPLSTVTFKDADQYAGALEGLAANRVNLTRGALVHRQTAGSCFGLTVKKTSDGFELGLKTNHDFVDIMTLQLLAAVEAQGASSVHESLEVEMHALALTLLDYIASDRSQQLRSRVVRRLMSI